MVFLNKQLALINLQTWEIVVIRSADVLEEKHHPQKQYISDNKLKGFIKTECCMYSSAIW